MEVCFREDPSRVRTGHAAENLAPLRGVACSIPQLEYADAMNNWIVADSEHLGGSPRVRGTRISVALILESLAADMSIPEIVDAYPSLTEESVRGALAELARQKELQPA